MGFEPTTYRIAEYCLNQLHYLMLPPRALKHVYLHGGVHVCKKIKLNSVA
jgi:hypothetical protein